MLDLSIYMSRREGQKGSPTIINRNKKVVDSTNVTKRKVIKGGCCFKSK
jgi:hypothetical protein